MQWNWLLSQKKLQQLGIDAILNRYLIIALQQFPDPVTSFEKVKHVCVTAEGVFFFAFVVFLPVMQSVFIQLTTKKFV